MTVDPYRLSRFQSVAMIVAAALLLASSMVGAQERDTPVGEWRQWGGDLGSTRYSPLDQINAENFEDLEVAWTWRGDNFGPEVDYVLRSTPIYAAGKLFTVAGARRTVAAIDPATGETLWTFREPHTVRYERSERFNYGRGVTYAEVDGRGVIYLVTPAFFLHALDAETGWPLEGFGGPIPVEGFSETGTVDLLADLGHPYDPYEGIDREVGTITNSHPPTVVNGVVIVGSAGMRGRYQTREENVPGDVLAYDARTGEHLWTFHVIPHEGEFGIDTWETDAWSRVGNANPWGGMSADPELGLVYFGPDAVMNDYYGGAHPGQNLFSNTIVAVDVRTGERRWHYQLVHHDVWDFDVPVPSNLVDVTIDGERIPALVQTTKQGRVYAFNRATGEPLWPIEEREVPPSTAPGEHAWPTQPFPTKPAPYEMQGLSDDDLIDFTPELHAMALEAVEDFYRVPDHPFATWIARDNPDSLVATIGCPANQGGTNIQGGAAVDPETGILYVESAKQCVARFLVPGEERDTPDSPLTAGRTISQMVAGTTAVPNVEGLPIFKPPYGRITAIDMNTGETLWWIPNGGTPESVRDHPLLEGLDIPATGYRSHATILVTSTLMMYGEGRSGEALFHAVDKQTGEALGTIEIPAPTSTAPMTFEHEGRQYIALSIGGDGMPGSVVALSLESDSGGGRGGFGGRGGGRGGGGRGGDGDDGPGGGRGGPSN